MYINNIVWLELTFFDSVLRRFTLLGT